MEQGLKRNERTLLFKNNFKFDAYDINAHAHCRRFIAIRCFFQIYSYTRKHLNYDCAFHHCRPCIRLYVLCSYQT